MINNIKLGNFKIHQNLNLSLSNLTILTGMNGMGKSSIIQSLLLLRQSYLSNDLSEGLNLKGDLCDLGSSGDVESQSASDNHLYLTITDDIKTNDFSFKFSDDVNDTFLTSDTELSLENLKELGNISLFNDNFQYISAFRWGPHKTYERDTASVKTKHQISKVNGQCEYAVHYLYHYRNDNIPIKGLALNEIDDIAEDYSLLNQTERWLRDISPGIHIYISEDNTDLKLNYRFDRVGKQRTDNISAINTGFGITYVLPIVVAVLSARPGSILLIENPEAHIHPQGQARLMDLISLAASNGVQIIIESHSDHIINGALRNVHDSVLDTTMLSIYFFNRDDRTHTSNAYALEIDDDGNISNPPDGFFDQIEIDMSRIMGLDTDGNNE